jgi:predicted nucleic acid-binding protein
MTPPAAPLPRSVFVDSPAYYALADLRDRNHRSALAILERLERQSPRPRVFATNFVRAEAHALLLNRLGRPAAMRLLTELASGGTTLVRVTARDERRALEIIERYQDKEFSLTDATSFAVMERLGIEAAFAFDRDFRQYGLPVLQP